MNVSSQSHSYRKEDMLIMDSIFSPLKHIGYEKELHFLTFVFVFACVLNMQAQNFETDIAKVLSQDETLLSFNKNEAGNISGILTSGSIKFTSPNGHVRILVADEYGYEKLIYFMNRFPSLLSKKVRTILNLWGLRLGK